MRHILSTLAYFKINRLFFDTEYPLNVASIRIIQDRLKFEEPVAAITAFDYILSNIKLPSMYDHELIDEKYGRIIGHLINYTVKEEEARFHPYIYETFQCFADHKEKIQISLLLWRSKMHKDFSKMLVHNIMPNQILSPFNRTLSGFNRSRGGKTAKNYNGWLCHYSTNNLIKFRLFEVFRNVNELLIEAQDYPFSLILFLSTIENTAVKRVTIRTTLKDSLPSPKSLEFNSLQRRFNIKGFTIRLLITSTVNTVVINKTC